MEGTWVDGNIHGEGRVFHPKTGLWKNYTFVNGKKLQNEEEITYDGNVHTLD